MRLVEVAFSEEASADTRRRTVELCVSLDKKPIEVPAVPGYVVNTLLFPYLFHAVKFMPRHRMVPEMVDACMQMGAAHPMGPIALLDFIGLAVAVAIGDGQGHDVPQIIRDRVATGGYGKKTRGGLYPASRYAERAMIG